MADFLSRSDLSKTDKLGKYYTTLEDDSLVPNPVDVSALEEVSLQTLTPKALAESQALCPAIKCHKE